MKDAESTSLGLLRGLQEEGGSGPKTLNQCEDWLDESYRREGPSKKPWKCDSSVCCNAFHYLYVKYDTNIVKMHMGANIKKTDWHNL